MPANQPTLEHLKPSQIAPHPDNVRTDVGDVSDLAASIAEVGVLEPLVVVTVDREQHPDAPKGATHLLLAGHRRLTAAKSKSLRTVPCLVRSDLQSRREQIKVMLIENCHRADLSPIEEGNAYQLLLDITPDATQAKVDADLGQPTKRVRDRIRLTRLPDGVQTRIHEGQIQLGEAAALLEFADEPDLLADLEKAAGTGEFRWHLERAQRTLNQRKDYRATEKALAKSSITVLDESPKTYVAGSTLDPLSWHFSDFGLTYETTSQELIDRADEIPGLCVYLDADAQRVYWFCTKIERTPRTVEDVDLPQSPEEIEAREAEDARREQEQRTREELQVSLDAAAAVRRDHVGGILHTPGNEDLAKRLLIRWLMAEDNEQGLHWPMRSNLWPVLAKLLRLAPETAPDGRHDLVARKLDKLPMAGLVLLGTTPWYEDDALARPGGVPSAYDDDPSIEWIHTLTGDLAYPWTEFERAHLHLNDAGHVGGGADNDEDAA